MTGVSVLRLDLIGGRAPGNKSFKLRANLDSARDQGLNRILSFGGAWSNHLHALAATGLEHGFETIGIVRGEKPVKPSAMLTDASDWGMHLVHVSRAEYRQRNEPGYIERLHKQFGPCLIVPEGGANVLGTIGCKPLANLSVVGKTPPTRVLVPVGTGTTLAGLAMGLAADIELLGVAVLKGAEHLDSEIQRLLQDHGAEHSDNWRILHDRHCGGYARVTPQLKEFIVEFERVQQIPLDPVYTGKMLFALWQMIADNSAPGQSVAIHTGGLQGRRGFPWLVDAAR